MFVFVDIFEVFVQERTQIPISDFKKVDKNLYHKK